jgi:hypothetical protein
MKKFVLGAFVASLAVLAVPAYASPDMAMDATMICRPATAKEKPMAMMGTKGMVCKTMDTKMMMSPTMGPKVAGMDSAKTDAAWRAWVQQMLVIQSATGTAGGNG